MSEDEKNVYGDRMIENYEKIDLLGKYFRISILIFIKIKGRICFGVARSR